MPTLQYPHLFLNTDAEANSFTTTKQGRENANFPDRANRKSHAEFIRKALDDAWKKSNGRFEERKSISLPTRIGTYIEFESAPNFDLKTKSLDLPASGIRLLNVAKRTDINGKEVTFATVFIPSGKKQILLNRIEQYETENTKTGNPKHNDFITSVNNLREAVVGSFWRDKTELLPQEPDWCEAWLRYGETDQTVSAKFIELCNALDIEVQRDYLTFPERIVMLIKASNEQLTELVNSSDDLAEFRKAKATAGFFTELDNRTQSEFAKDLVNRISVNSDSQVFACVIDTGVNNGHVLLEPVLGNRDCHTVKREWGVNDNHKHGTLMGGIVTYGNKINELLQSTDNILVLHRLESVKLIPEPGEHHSKDLFGLRTKQAISLAEVERPQVVRTICMAISSEDDRDEGRPSSWSASIDQLCCGSEDGTRRLIVLAGGNITSPDEWKNYPASNMTQAVHDPAQAWNALTVGAYTEKINITNQNSTDYSPLASFGQLSPFSTTSVIWDSKWPNKPDVVFEGGNVGIDSTGFTSEFDDLSLLSTFYKPLEGQFYPINMTSAAAALATWMSVQLQVQYPESWPETIRALIVHSAEWTEALRSQMSSPKFSNKKNIQHLLRTCGYGVPNFRQAMESASNSLTIIAEELIQPFESKEKGLEYKTKDMHLIELPWPKDALNDLPGETPVRINVTLSYFIEPAPGEVGWRDKYRYRSHGLAFELIGPSESKAEFLQRLNKAAADEDGKYGGSSPIEWAVGSNSRSKGSIHRDWWDTTAANAAECGMIAIYPQIGWWKERSHLRLGESISRYSLVATLETPPELVDIYTPIASDTRVRTIVSV